MTTGEIAQIESSPKIGVLSYQGDVREHSAVLEALHARPILVNKAEHLEGLAGLILPGGESTTIGNLLAHFGLDEAIRKRYEEGMGIFGTCAGLILLAKEIEGREQPGLRLMDITAARNAFGRQIQSFESEIAVPALGDPPVHAVFIRAPYISRTGPGVQTLAVFNDRVVLARQGRLLAGAFHPELIGETRLHQYFLEIVTGRAE